MGLLVLVGAIVLTFVCLGGFLIAMVG